jgi:hypothetical protein
MDAYIVSDNITVTPEKSDVLDGLVCSKHPVLNISHVD